RGQRRHGCPDGEWHRHAPDREARRARCRRETHDVLDARPRRLARCRSDREGGSHAPRAGSRGRTRGDMTDEIVLTLPRERRFYDVAHLVVGGLAVRLNLTVDNLADLQLALTSLLPRAEADGDVTVALQLAGETLT